MMTTPCRTPNPPSMAARGIPNGYATWRAIAWLAARRVMTPRRRLAARPAQWFDTGPGLLLMVSAFGGDAERT